MPLTGFIVTVRNAYEITVHLNFHLADKSQCHGFQVLKSVLSPTFAVYFYRLLVTFNRQYRFKICSCVFCNAI